MQKKLLFMVPIVVSVIASSLLTFSGCGNSWIDSGERQKTPSALMFEAQQAYDKAASPADYAKASSAYRKVLLIDPTNTTARVGLAFALNGEAGLSLFDIVANVVKGQNTSTSLNLTSASSIDTVRKVVGLNDTDIAQLEANCGNDLMNCRNKTGAELQAASTKFAKLHEAWLAICPAMSETIIASLAADAITNALFELDKCKGGIPDKDVQVAPIFAAAISNLGFGMGLFQIIDQLPLNAPDGQPDVISEVQAKFTATMAEITALQTRMADLSDATKDGVNLTATTCGTMLSIPEICRASLMTATLAELNTKIVSLKTAIGSVKSDINNMTLATLDLLSALAKELGVKAGLPAQIISTIDGATSGLTKAKTQLDGYSTNVSTTGGSSAPTATGTAAPTASASNEKAAAAAANADTMIGQQAAKLNAIKDSAGAPEQIAAMKAQQTQICTNFGDMAIAAGLGAGAEKPCACGETEALKVGCCAKKTDATKKAECCGGIYDAADTAYATKVTACNAAAALTNNFTANLYSSKVKEPKKVMENKNADVNLIEFFQAAETARRSN